VEYLALHQILLVLAEQQLQIIFLELPAYLLQLQEMAARRGVVQVREGRQARQQIHF
jgi:hypothetical protein